MEFMETIKLNSPDEAASMFTENFAVYNSNKGFLVIPDIVEIDGRTDEELNEQYNGYGIKAPDDTYIINVMYCEIDPGKADEYREKYGCLEEYALSEVPAPASFAPGSMDSEGVTSHDDVVRFFEKYFKEYGPDGWEVD